jgi:hypothetical protein
VVTGAGEGADAWPAEGPSSGDEDSSAVDAESPVEESPAVESESGDDAPAPELEAAPVAEALVAPAADPDEVDTAAGLAAPRPAAASAGSCPEDSCTKIVAHAAMNRATVSPHSTSADATDAALTGLEARQGPLAGILARLPRRHAGRRKVLWHGGHGNEASPSHVKSP